MVGHIPNLRDAAIVEDLWNLVRRTRRGHPVGYRDRDRLRRDPGGVPEEGQEARHLAVVGFCHHGKPDPGCCLLPAERDHDRVGRRVHPGGGFRRENTQLHLSSKMGNF